MKRYRSSAFCEVICTSVGLLLAITGCNRSGQGSAQPAPGDQTVERPVHYVEVSRLSMPETLDLAAKVQADPTKIFHIYPPASGRIVELQVRLGDRVERGQTIAVLESTDIASARSDFTKAKVEAERAASAADREKLLFDHGAAAEKDYVDARAQSDTAFAELARARQHLEMLNINPSATRDLVTLQSPAGGVILDVNAAPGEFSKSLESANPLVTIANLDTVWIVGDVYEKDVAKLQRGKGVSITVDAYPGRRWTGHIDSLSGALDPTTRTLRLRVALSNPGEHLKPEMFAMIHVNTGTHESAAVPATAIIREGQTTTVFVEEAGKSEQRTVTIGQTLDGMVEVLSGLRAGQRIAADGAELLTGGQAQ